MKIPLNSRKQPLVLAIKVKTKKPEDIVIQVYDPNKPNTYYTNRKGKVRGERLFYIRMPQSPEKGIIRIYNVKNGDLRVGKDRTLDIWIKRLPLKAQLNVFGNKNPVVQDFLRFSRSFSERAAILDSNKAVYQSNDGQFRILYLDEIKDYESGETLRTPARVNQNKGIIEISKKHFLEYTVPMRMAILLHEFSHFYLNKNKNDETEADLNALIIYLGAGYPRIEAQQAYLKIFKGSPSDQNKYRHQIITKFIDNFENIRWRAA